MFIDVFWYVQLGLYLSVAMYPKLLKACPSIYGFYLFPHFGLLILGYLSQSSMRRLEVFIGTMPVIVFIFQIMAELDALIFTDRFCWELIVPCISFWQMQVTLFPSSWPLPPFEDAIILPCKSHFLNRLSITLKWWCSFLDIRLWCLCSSITCDIFRWWVRPTEVFDGDLLWTSYLMWP